MTIARTTQVAVETLSDGTPAVRESQLAIEVLSLVIPNLVETQVVVETLSTTALVPTSLLVSHEAVEVVSSAADNNFAKTTQVVVETLSRDRAGIDLTQAVRLAVVGMLPAERTTEMVRLSVVEMFTQIEATQLVRLTLADAIPCLTFWAHCWRIVRTDGRVLAFTSHDQDMVFRGETYKTCDSLSASASELGALLGDIGNMELAGVLTDASITEADMFGGMFDGAELEVWLVPWSDVGGEVPRRLLAGRTGTLKHGAGSYTMEVLTMSAQLQQKAIIQTYTPGCRFELGDSRCTVDLPALIVAGAVTTVAERHAQNQAQNRIFTDASRAEATDYFNFGVLIWTSGANLGERAEVKTYDLATQQFVLWEPMIYPIAVGDTFTVAPGCDRLKATCVAKFNNYINFGGFADVPGGDAISAHPNAGGGLG